MLVNFELEDCDWSMLGFFDIEEFLVSGGWFRFRFLIWVGYFVGFDI